MSLNQRLTTEFSPCTPSTSQSRDLSIQNNSGKCRLPYSRQIEVSDQIADGSSVGTAHTDQLTKVTTHTPVRFRSIHRWLPRVCLQIESSPTKT